MRVSEMDARQIEIASLAYWNAPRMILRMVPSGCCSSRDHCVVGSTGRGFATLPDPVIAGHLHQTSGCA